MLKKKRSFRVAPHASNLEKKATLAPSGARPDIFKNDRKWYLIYPDQTLHKTWGWLRVLTLLNVAFFVPLRVSFHEATNPGYEEVVETMELAWDIVFIADTVFPFFTVYWENKQFERRLVDNLPEISGRYFSSGQFYIDFLSAIPVDTAINLSGIHGREQLRFIDLFRLVQMMKLYHMSTFFRKLEAQYNLNQGLLRMISIMYMIGLVTHCVGCVWVTIGVEFSEHVEDCEVHYRCTIGNLSLDDPNDVCSTHDYSADFKNLGCTWTFRDGYFERPQINIYSASIYWAFSTLTTVGYGDISATNSREQVFSMFIMLLGVSWYAYIVSAVSTIVAGLEGQRRVIRDRIAAVNRFSVDFELSMDLKRRVRKYYEYVYTTQSRWQEKDSYNTEEILQGLHSQLRLDVILYVERDLISKIPFLADKPSQCKADFVSSVRPIIVPEGDYIIFEGSTAKEMYFLMRGRVGVFYGRKLVNVVGAPTYFGEAGCVKGGIRTASIAALTTCELQVLPQRKLVHLINSYPEVRREIVTREAVRDFKKIVSNKPGLHNGEVSPVRSPMSASEDKDTEALVAADKLAEKVFAIFERVEMLAEKLEKHMAAGSLSATNATARPSEARPDNLSPGSRAATRTMARPSETRMSELMQIFRTAAWSGVRKRKEEQTRQEEIRK